MGEEKKEGVARGRQACAVCGKVAAAVSLALLVPAIRKLRARQHKPPRRHFPLFGH